MKLRNKKTGEVIVEISKISILGYKFGIPAEISQYYSLAELNEEWEDYKPKDPLIKDEKIRKAVRAWAEVNGISDAPVFCGKYDNGFEAKDIEVYIEFDEAICDIGSMVERGKDYTIAELCGEEEE
jgi:hypothetical protein